MLDYSTKKCVKRAILFTSFHIFSQCFTLTTYFHNLSSFELPAILLNWQRSCHRLDTYPEDRIQLPFVSLSTFLCDSMTFWGNDPAIAVCSWQACFGCWSSWSWRSTVWRFCVLGSLVMETSSVRMQTKTCKKSRTSQEYCVKNILWRIYCVHSAQSSGGMFSFFWTHMAKHNLAAWISYHHINKKWFITHIELLEHASSQRCYEQTTSPSLDMNYAAGNVQFGEYFDVHFVRHGEQLEFDEICPPLWREPWHFVAMLAMACTCEKTPVFGDDGFQLTGNDWNITITITITIFIYIYLYIYICTQIYSIVYENVHTIYYIYIHRGICCLGTMDANPHLP